MSTKKATAYEDWLYMKTIRPQIYNCHFIDHDFNIDGDINKQEWNSVPFSADFVDIEGERQIKPKQVTQVKMLWSENYFYFAAKLIEPQITATITNKNEVIFHDNDFEIFIDPDSDNANYYEFEINAFGTIWELNLPLAYKDGGSPINPYNIAGLKSAVQVEGKINDPSNFDEYWTVEVAIPWKGLKPFHQRGQAAPRPGDYWRVNFSRVEWDHEIVDGKLQKIPNRPEHNWVWSPQGVIDMHRPERWGFVYFENSVGKSTVCITDPRDCITEQLKLIALDVYYLQRSTMLERSAVINNERQVPLEPHYLGLDEIKNQLPPADLPFLKNIYLLQKGYLAHLEMNGVNLFIDHHSRITF